MQEGPGGSEGTSRLKDDRFSTAAPQRSLVSLCSLGTPSFVYCCRRESHTVAFSGYTILLGSSTATDVRIYWHYDSNSSRDSVSPTYRQSYRSNASEESLLRLCEYKTKVSTNFCQQRTLQVSEQIMTKLGRIKRCMICGRCFT